MIKILFGFSILLAVGNLQAQYFEEDKCGFDYEASMQLLKTAGAEGADTLIFDMTAC